MFNFLSDASLLVSGLVLAGLQLLAALPWLTAIDPRGFGKSVRTPAGIGQAVLVWLACSVGVAMYLGYQGESAQLATIGKYYGAVLHAQLLIDLFILAPVALLWITPKTGAVALAAYREAWRQPMFWLITVGALALMTVSVLVPYFTFGDDYKMMKQIGFDITKLAAVLFGVLAAATAISEEIEGRTAVTVMSKPINRRNFLFGKFAGILLACMAMTLILAWVFNWALMANREFEKIETVVDPLALQVKQDLLVVLDRPPAEGEPARELTWVGEVSSAVSRVAFRPGRAGNTFARGAGDWACENVANTPGVVLGFGQVMILVAIASALATRMTFVVNILLSLIVYFLGHLAPVVVRATDKLPGGNAGVGMVRFLGQMFDVILPALDFFNMGPAIIRETPLNFWAHTWYVGSVFGYSVIYTLIFLIVGLLMFEDRDLA
jgi:ABC-2 family transporter protein